MWIKTVNCIFENKIIFLCIPRLFLLMRHKLRSQSFFSRLTQLLTEHQSAARRLDVGWAYFECFRSFYYNNAVIISNRTGVLSWKRTNFLKINGILSGDSFFLNLSNFEIIKNRSFPQKKRIHFKGIINIL